MLTVFWKGYKMVHFVGAGSGAADLITIREKNFWKMQILLFMPVRL